MPGEGGHVAGTRRAVRVQAELRELDRELGPERALAHPVEQLEVVIADRLRLGFESHLLAQLGEHRAEPHLGEPCRGGERRLRLLARQEAPHGSAQERALAELAREPRAARGSEQEAAGEGHGPREIAPSGRRGERGRGWGRGRRCAVDLTMIQLYHHNDTLTVAH